MNSGINLLYVVMACGIIAVLYGIITSRQLLSLSSGNQRMVEVSAAIQEGAAAYLKRQYTTIAIVGIIVAIIIGILPEAPVRRRVPHRRGPFRLDGLHRHEHIGPCKRPHRGGRSLEPAEGPHHSLPGGCSHRSSCRGACPSRDYRSVLVPHRPWRLCAERPGGRQCAHRSRARRLARFHLRASRRGHLHQGRRRRR